MELNETAIALLVSLGLLILYLMTVGFLVTSGWILGLYLARGDLPDDVQAAAFDAIHPRWRSRLIGQFVETLVAAFDIALRFFYLLRLLPKLRDPGSGTPIVMLPGFTENAGAMWWFARRLARRGYRPVLIDFPSTFHRLDTNVKFLAMRLRQLRAESGHDKVAIVAHSMGGVIARAHMLSDPDHGVLSLVAIASPFRGTHMARLGAAFRFGSSSLDMVPNSEFALRFPPDLTTSAPIHVIVGCQENIVSPAWSCVLPGCDTFVLSLPVGHDAPLHLNESYERLEKWLVEDGVQPAQARDAEEQVKSRA